MQSTEKNVIAVMLDETESVCPVCLKIIAAQVIDQNKAVYMKKTCPDHGEFLTNLWPDVDHYRWMKRFQFPFVRPEKPVASQHGCLEDCGLCRAHLRHPTLVEIELTERCNLRCPVCFMSAEAARAYSHEPDLADLERIYDTIMAKTGPQTSIQLTGGEPTVRDDLAEIVNLGRLKGFNAIEVNTNGLRIAGDASYAACLAEAGISGFYLQFDGLTQSVYEKIRGADLLGEKIKAIENCRKAGVQVVLAMTVIAGINDDQMGAVLEFALNNREVIAGIAYQPAFGSGRFDVMPKRRLTMGDIICDLSKQSRGLIEPYDFWPLGCSHPLCDAATYLVEDHRGVINPLTRLITPSQYVENFDANSPQGSVFGDMAVKLFPQFEPGLSIVIMNFMDAMSIDLKRLRECSMTVAGQDGRIIPFCAYQLTDIDGQRKKRKYHNRG